MNTDYKDIGEYFKNKNINQVTLKDLRSAILSIRARKFPNLNKFGTAGSFFKNPTVSRNFYERLQEKYPQIPAYLVGKNFRIPLAWILDNVVSLKGFRKGSVGLYEKQPLVLVNFGGASANDVKNLANEITQIIKEKVEIEIEQEVVCL